MQHLKVRKVGNSLGVILPREVAAAMDVEEGDEVLVAEVARGRLSLCRVDDDFAAEIKAAEKIMDRYRNALAELAK